MDAQTGAKLVRRAGLRKKSDGQAVLERLDELATAVVILRDGDVCAWGATEVVPQCWGPLQTHHIWPKGHYPWMRYVFPNLIRFCRFHHLDRWHGTNPMWAAEWRAANLEPAREKLLYVMAHARRPLREVFDAELVRLAIANERRRLLDRRVA